MTHTAFGTLLAVEPAFDALGRTARTEPAFERHTDDLADISTAWSVGS